MCAYCQWLIKPSGIYSKSLNHCLQAFFGHRRKVGYPYTHSHIHFHKGFAHTYNWPHVATDWDTRTWITHIYWYNDVREKYKWLRGGRRKWEKTRQVHRMVIYSTLLWEILSKVYRMQTPNSYVPSCMPCSGTTVWPHTAPRSSSSSQTTPPTSTSW